MKRKRIVFISPNSYPLLSRDTKSQLAGGAEIQLVTIGIELAKNRNLEVIFIANDFGQQDIETIGNITIHKFRLRYFGGSNRYLIFDWLDFLKGLKKINPDMIFLKLPKDLLTPVGIFCKLYKKKLIYIGQSDKDVDIKLLFEFQSKVATLFYRFGLMFVDHFIAQTRVQFDGFGKFSRNVRQINNIATIKFQSSIEKKNFILWVGNGTANKQPNLFIEIAKKLPGLNFKMILSDLNQETTDTYYNSITSELENFEYIGFVKFDKIAGYFSRACLLINTSLREGFPNVFLQAWQCLTPVISLKINPDEVITKFNIGRVSKEFHNLICDVNELMKNSKLRNEMGANGYKYIMENHSAEVIIPEYDRLIVE